MRFSQESIPENLVNKKSKLIEAMAVYLVKQACGNNILASVYIQILCKHFTILISTALKYVLCSMYNKIGKIALCAPT